MSWIQKTLSIFGWKKNEVPLNSEITHEEKGKNKITTIQDLKEWFEKELPPLALQRVNLRIAKYALLNYNITLNKADGNLIIPKELLDKINQIVKELFNKELPNGN